MSFSLEDIHTLLAGGITVGRELLLEAGMFDEMGQTLAPLGRTDLLLKEAEVEFADRKITVRGKTDLLKLSGLTTRLEITGEAEQRLCFRFDLPPGWNFLKSFSNLPPSYKNENGNPGLVSLQPSVLYDFAFKGAAFVLQNFDAGPLTAGLNFSGDLADADPLGYLKDLLGIVGGTTLLQGPVRLKGDQPPELHLKFVIGSPHLQLGPALKVTEVDCQLRTAPPTDGDGEPQTRLELVGKFGIGRTDPITFSATTPIYSGTSIFSFDAEIDGVLTIRRGVNALVEFTGGSAVDFELPNGLNILDQFYLKDFSVSADPVARSVRHIQLTVASDQRWHIFGDIEVSDIKFGWLFLFPFSDVARATSATVSGTLALGHADKVSFDVTASRYAGFTVTGSLRKGDTLRLSKLIELVLGGSPGGLSALYIDFLEIEAGTTGDFSVEGTLKSEWKLEVGDETLALEQISLSFSRKGSEKKGTLSSFLKIAGAKLYLTAGVPDSGQGITFDGGTYGDNQELNLTEVADYLLRKFGVALPSSLPHVLVKKLSTTFNTATKDFTFVARGSFQVHDKLVEITLNIKLTQKQGGSYAGDFGGQIKVGDSTFTLTFSKDGSAKSFVGAYHDKDGVAIPLKSFVEKISSDVARIVPEGLRVELKDVLFGFKKDGKGNKFLFGVDFGKVSLSSLPLVGELPPDQGVSVDDLRLLVTSAGLNAQEVAELNKVIPAGIAKLPAGTQGGAGEVVLKGLTVTAKMNFGGSSEELNMQVGGGVRRSTAGDSSVAAASSSDGVKWFVLQKSFGPVYFDKVGVQYQDAALRFLLNAALSAAGLTLSLDGLSVGSPLSKFEPKFDLRGLGIEYKAGDVEIGGAFLRTGTEGHYSYDGAAVIKTKQFALSAIGSYTELKAEPSSTQLKSEPSLFIYAFLDYPLGGPAFFFVTGLAAGFGYNRRLIAPSIEKVADFPLITQAMGRQPASKNVTEALTSLRDHVPPSLGSIFLAVGVKFNSFKLVDSFALLTFEFGNNFAINLLGISTAVVPTPEAGKVVTPLAQVQIAWKATFNPDDGCLGIDARLTPNSYILSKDCRLSGGYAFYSWFSGPHAGDFVQTLGGYHPKFDIPPHYPRVPRLAFDWRVSNSLTIQGDAYYALTGSALMAGGHLEVLYKQGELRAWLKVGADFLIAWKPYHYDASLYVNVGASYTFDIDLLFGHIRATISVDVGAQLHLWGPDFSGTATIDLSVISFTIAFGAGASQTPPPIKEWSKFQESFLPEKDVCSISVKDGLVRKIEAGGKDRWVINPKEFALVVDSAIPFKSAPPAIAGNKDLADGANLDFGICPMAVSKAKFSSKLTVTIKRGLEVVNGEFNYSAINKRVPAGLWRNNENNVAPNLSGDVFLKNVPSGVEIAPGKHPAPGETARIDLGVFKFSDTQYTRGADPTAFGWETVGAFVPLLGAKDARAKRKAIRDGVGSNPARDSLLKAMNVKVDVNIKGAVADDFVSAPQIGKL